MGGNAVSIILQISSFLNDFCEFMDKVLSTNDWRECISANGRRIARKRLETVQEADIVDRCLSLSFVHYIFEGSCRSLNLNTLGMKR